eukprot:scaffold2192_cov268-Chaetoceros_neogracile.AAC.71
MNLCHHCKVYITGRDAEHDEFHERHASRAPWNAKLPKADRYKASRTLHPSSPSGKLNVFSNIVWPKEDRVRLPRDVKGNPGPVIWDSGASVCVEPTKENFLCYTKDVDEDQCRKKNWMEAVPSLREKHRRMEKSIILPLRHSVLPLEYRLAHLQSKDCLGDPYLQLAGLLSALRESHT